MFQMSWVNTPGVIRPSASRPSAISSDGNAASTMRLVATMDHEKTGIRSMVMPGARRSSTVHSTVPATRIMPRLAAKLPRIHRSVPNPGENSALESGV